jgi:hypothetical protein
VLEDESDRPPAISRWRDLYQELSKLLDEIDKGRETARQRQHVQDEYDDAIKRQTAAHARRAELLRRIPAACQNFEKELSLRQSEVQECEREVRDFARTYSDAFEFIWNFGTTIKLFLDRLPLAPEWRPYSRALARLRIEDPVVWTDPANPNLETLKIRLIEMRDITRRKLDDERGAIRPRSRGRPVKTTIESIRKTVIKISQSPSHDGMPLSHKELCDRLDAHQVKMPAGAGWSKCGSWGQAYSHSCNAVKRWLSGTLRRSS